MDSRLPQAKALPLSQDALGKLMPMHLCLDKAGHVIGYGPTLGRVFRDSGIVPARFLDEFEVRRPSGVTSSHKLHLMAGERLQLPLKTGDAGFSFRGLCLPVEGGGYILNLSFGIGVVDAVRELSLSEADFAPTDLAIELLYLVEAKTAVMRELRDLNLRLQEAKVAAEQQALTDTLTGLRNRRALEAEMNRLIAHGSRFALLHLDLDYFKQVNDTLGHAAGDFVLCEVARFLTRETRSSDTVARVGGDEFVILLNRIDDPATIQRIAEQIIAALSVPMEYDGKSCRISGSIGITLSAGYAAPQIEVMYADADAALYTSKRSGRGVATLHQPEMAMAQRA